MTGPIKLPLKLLHCCAGTNVEADWLDAVVVALDHMKNFTEGTKCVNKKIVLLSDLGCPASEDKVDVIIKGMEMEGVEFTFM